MADHAFRGVGLEDSLEWMHKSYEGFERAVIEKAGTRASPKRIDGSTVIWIPDISLPDYAGVIAGGRAVFFDAKQTSNKNSWSLSKKSQHQFDSLKRFASMGALCFFLIEHAPKQTCYLIMIDERAEGMDVLPRLKFPRLDIANRVHEYIDYPLNVVLFGLDDHGMYDWLRLFDKWEE